jgi:hypothetical protein
VLSFPPGALGLLTASRLALRRSDRSVIATACTVRRPSARLTAGRRAVITEAACHWQRGEPGYCSPCERQRRSRPLPSHARFLLAIDSSAARTCGGVGEAALMHDPLTRNDGPDASHVPRDLRVLY